MIDPTIIAVQVCSRAQLCSEKDVLLNGAGALGSSLLRIIKLFELHTTSSPPTSTARSSRRRWTTVLLHRQLHEGGQAVRMKGRTGGYGSPVAIARPAVKDSLIGVCSTAGNATRVITMGFGVAPDEINQFSSPRRNWTCAGAACRTTSSARSSGSSIRASWNCAVRSRTPSIFWTRGRPSTLSIAALPPSARSR